MFSFSIFPKNIIAISLDKNEGVVNFINKKNILTSKTNEFLKNRFNINDKQIYSCEQVHGNKISLLNLDKNFYPQCDGLVTNIPNVSLLVKTADCVPIFLYDPIKNAIGLIHSGWRGTYHHIGINALKTMIKNYDSKPENVLIGFGPCAHKCCYFFNKNQPHKIILKDKSWNDFIKIKNGYFYADLVGFIKNDFIHNGVLVKNIEASKICTICNVNFHSWRRQCLLGGERGNGINLMMIQ